MTVDPCLWNLGFILWDLPFTLYTVVAYLFKNSLSKNFTSGECKITTHYSSLTGIAKSSLRFPYIGENKSLRFQYPILTNLWVKACLVKHDIIISTQGLKILYL